MPLAMKLAGAAAVRLALPRVGLVFADLPVEALEPTFERAAARGWTAFAERAPDEVKRHVDVFGPPPDTLPLMRALKRRFERIGEAAGVQVVDDYGHHPAEIVATLAAARELHEGRLVVAFQPHRFTRTQSLWEDFTRAFNDADVLIFAGAPLSGLAERVADRIPVPVIDQVVAAVKQAEALVALRLRKATAGTFKRPAAKPTTGLAGALAARLEHRDR